VVLRIADVNVRRRVLGLRAFVVSRRSLSGCHQRREARALRAPRHRRRYIKNAGDSVDAEAGTNAGFTVGFSVAAEIEASEGEFL
jgi:hypothetical protein